MKEEEWNACTDPKPMLRFLSGKGSPRQFRLLLCAYYRIFWGILVEAEYREAVEAAEKYLEGQSTEFDLNEVYLKARTAHWMRNPQTNRDVDYRTWSRLYLAQVAAAPDDRINRLATHSETPIAGWSEPSEQRNCFCFLLREVFGNPFRPVVVDPSWVTSTVQALAGAAYENRDLPSGTLQLDRLAVLADALEDAGCTSPAVLVHLRTLGPHIRGCHVLDLILHQNGTP